MKRLLIVLVVTLACVFVIAGCSSTTATTPAASAPKTPSATQAASASVLPTQQLAQVSGAPLYGGTLKYVVSEGPGSPMGNPPEASGSATSTMQFALEPP